MCTTTQRLSLFQEGWSVQQKGSFFRQKGVNLILFWTSRLFDTWSIGLCAFVYFFSLHHHQQNWIHIFQPAEEKETYIAAINKSLFYSNVAKKSFNLRPHKSYHHLLTRKEAKKTKTFCAAKKHSIIKNESFFHQYKKGNKVRMERKYIFI